MVLSEEHISSLRSHYGTDAFIGRAFVDAHTSKDFSLIGQDETEELLKHSDSLFDEAKKLVDQVDWQVVTEAQIPEQETIFQDLYTYASRLSVAGVGSVKSLLSGLKDGLGAFWQYVASLLGENASSIISMLRDETTWLGYAYNKLISAAGALTKVTLGLFHAIGKGIAILLSTVFRVVEKAMTVIGKVASEFCTFLTTTNLSFKAKRMATKFFFFVASGFVEIMELAGATATIIRVKVQAFIKQLSEQISMLMDKFEKKFGITEALRIVNKYDYPIIFKNMAYYFKKGGVTILSALAVPLRWLTKGLRLWRGGISGFLMGIITDAASFVANVIASKFRVGDGAVGPDFIETVEVADAVLHKGGFSEDQRAKLQESVDACKAFLKQSDEFVGKRAYSSPKSMWESSWNAAELLTKEYFDEPVTEEEYDVVSIQRTGLKKDEFIKRVKVLGANLQHNLNLAVAESVNEEAGGGAEPINGFFSFGPSFLPGEEKELSGITGDPNRPDGVGSLKKLVQQFENEIKRLQQLIENLSSREDETYKRYAGYGKITNQMLKQYHLEMGQIQQQIKEYRQKLKKAVRGEEISKNALLNFERRREGRVLTAVAITSFGFLAAMIWGYIAYQARVEREAVEDFEKRLFKVTGLSGPPQQVARKLIEEYRYEKTRVMTNYRMGTPEKLDRIGFFTMAKTYLEVDAVSPSYFVEKWKPVVLDAELEKSIYYAKERKTLPDFEKFCKFQNTTVAAASDSVVNDFIFQEVKGKVLGVIFDLQQQVEDKAKGPLEYLGNFFDWTYQKFEERTYAVSSAEAFTKMALGGIAYGNDQAIEAVALVLESSIILGLGTLVGIIIMILMVSHMIVAWSMGDSIVGDNTSQTISNLIGYALTIGMQVAGFYGPLYEKLLGNVRKHSEIRSNAMFMNFTLITSLMSSLFFGGMFGKILRPLFDFSAKSIAGKPIASDLRKYENKEAAILLERSRRIRQKIQKDVNESDKWVDKTGPTITIQ